MEIFDRSSNPKPNYTKSNIIANKNSISDKQEKLKKLEGESEQENKRPSPWIDAWSDSVAGINSISSLMELSDLSMDGDYNLIIGDLFDYQKNTNLKLSQQVQRKIKVYKGTNMVYDFSVEDRPVGLIASFDTTQKPNLPVIAVAVNSSIVYMKDFAPWKKFQLDLIEFTEEESKIWADLIKLAVPQDGNDATESS